MTIPIVDEDDFHPSQFVPKLEFFYDADKPLIVQLRGEPGQLAINLLKLIDVDTGKIKLTAINAAGGAGISSDPPEGGKPINNAYVGSDGKLRVDYED